MHIATEAGWACHDLEARGLPAKVPTHVSAPSLELLTVNQTCWLKAFFDGVSLKVWTRAPVLVHDARKTHF